MYRSTQGSKKRVILGISYGSHDCSAAVMVDGVLAAAAEEERYNMQKHTMAFPAHAAADCLATAGLTIEDVDILAHCSNFIDAKLLAEAGLWAQDGAGSDAEAVMYREVLSKYIAKQLSYKGEVMSFNHHLSHLASAYYTSGFKDAVVCSYDGVGESLSMLVCCAVDGNLCVPADPTAIGTPDPSTKSPPFFRKTYPNSLGILYSSFTHHLGFRFLEDEGIVMGLASYGDPNTIIPGGDITYTQLFEEVIEDHGPFDFQVSKQWQTLLIPDPVQGIRFEPSWPFLSGKAPHEVRLANLVGPRRQRGEPITQHHKNLAAGLQLRMEQVVIRDVKCAMDIYNIKSVCLAGGLALNCSMNGKILESGVDQVYVPAAPGDAGHSIGACFLAWKKLNPSFVPVRHNNYSLGARYTDEVIIKALEQEQKISYTTYADKRELWDVTAQALADKKVVAFFQGGSEFGPRALGNRSILSAPYPIAQKDYINQQVKFREYFRPLAPAVLLEEASNYFKINQESPHMLYAVPAVDDEVQQEKVCATLHVDKTARVQTVTSDLNPEFHGLITAFHKRTGVPVVLNTSFNVKGQPIVNTPAQALACFMSTNIDVLVIGSSYVVKRPSNFFNLFADQPDYYTRLATIECHDKFFLEKLLAHNVVNEKTTSVLSIGSGEGSMELAMLDKLPNMHITCLDPSTAYSQALRERVEKLGVGDRVRNICQTFETFYSDVKYDLIISVHSWYAFGPNKEMLQRVMGYLAPGGVFAIIVQAQNAIAHALTLLNDHLDYFNLTAEDFSKWLNANGFACTHTRLSQKVPMHTFVGDDGSVTQDGKDYASFLVADSWDTLQDSKKAEVRQTYLQKVEGDGSIDLACGLILLQKQQ